MKTRVSLVDLAAANIQLRPAEAVAIVAEICRRCGSGELHGVPTPGVIRLTRDGDMFVEGPMTTGNDVVLAAHLLSDILAAFDATPEYRASGALRLVVARALGTLDLPPYESLAEFCHALQRFSTIDLRDAAAALFEAWERARGSHDLLRRDLTALTISDIRRARRATGLTLQDVALVAEVPAVQLRHFEWGDMRQWHADDDGRAQVVRYARAAGLDQGLVLSIAWPLIEEQASALPMAVNSSVALVPSGPRHLLVYPPPKPAHRRPRYIGWIAAAVAALMLAVLTGLTIAQINSVPTPMVVSRPPGAVQIGIAATGAPPVLVVPRAAPAPSARPVRTLRPAAPSHSRPRRGQLQKPQSERKTSVLDRELIRFVFK